MKKMWAPWRMNYIREALSEKDDGKCVLCEIGKHTDKDPENFVVARGKLVYVVLNRFPYNNGHLMVTPYVHTSKMSGLSPEAVVELWEYTQRSQDALKKCANPDGYNIGLNLGRVAGAGIDQHIHLHIVPRWSGDTNYMPVLAGTKVISQALEETWKELKSSWE